MINSHKPKARLVILGFEDPQIENLARDSPTLGKDSRTLIFQYAASAKWRIRSFDVQTAFLRGSRSDGRILGMEPPVEMRHQMKLQPWECCELLKSAYGLCNAPLLWYEELKGALLNLGFQISPLDPCLFVLPKKGQKGIHGLVGIHVDDGLGAGDQVFDEAIRKLETKYPFGSTHHSDFQFTGIHVHQNWDGSIELDQTKYVEDIPHIEVPRDRRQTQDSLVSESERQSLRGLVGQPPIRCNKHSTWHISKTKSITGQDQQRMCERLVGSQQTIDGSQTPQGDQDHHQKYSTWRHSFCLIFQCSFCQSSERPIPKGLSHSCGI